ncbi:universal stress protein [Mycolicibacterium sp. BiH015]|uniref:universal stress protein n=1 Tax=Mycolicibacterium sp. BiH015 TaxID=3018808 RepID=UPI0022E84B90|nr:universal stress protein [Mycolicibacterium sp. BiH015]
MVGIDGSPAAVDAALWAIDQAADRDIPLRLVYVIDDQAGDAVDPQEQARRLSMADRAIRYAAGEVESTGRPVKIEVEVLHGRPVHTLREAARTAAMLCVGARGLRHCTRGAMGSTAAALSASALCPVAIVRTHRPQRRRDRAVVVEVTGNPAGSAVLDHGFEEARRRRAPVRVLTSARAHRDVEAQWERRLAEWRQRYPDLEITTAGNGDTVNYLTIHGESVQLVVVGRDRPGGVAALVGAPGNAALRDTDCSILVCESSNAL